MYLVTPVMVGTVRKEGTQRIVTEDGKHFTNINNAASYVLEQAGENDFAKTLDSYMRRGKSKVEITGVELIRKDKWNKFCKLRKIDMGDMNAMKKRYYLDATELKALEIT